jgi:hypothetical protein
VLRGAGRQVRRAGLLRVVKANSYRFPRELVVTAFVKWWKVSFLGVINRAKVVHTFHEMVACYSFVCTVLGFWHYECHNLKGVS